MSSRERHLVVKFTYVYILYANACSLSPALSLSLSLLTKELEEVTMKQPL